MFRKDFMETLRKATGAPEKFRSRGARLWVYLWRNLTHR